MVDTSDTQSKARLVTLDPPKPPVDLIQSALFLPISAISNTHQGRKIRTIGQVIAYDVKSSLLLLAAMPTQAIGPLATLLVDVSIPLLGQTPALDPLPEQQVTASTAGSRSRTLTLARGEYVTVVGWLEGDQSNLASKVDTGTAYLRPLALGLEAIYIANSRSPPEGAVYRGTIKGWDGFPTPT